MVKKCCIYVQMCQYVVEAAHEKRTRLVKAMSQK